MSVQAPVGVAANVCDVDASVLAKQKQAGTAERTASITATALNQIVQKQVASQ